MTDKYDVMEDVRNLLKYAKSLGMTEVPAPKSQMVQSMPAGRTQKTSAQRSKTITKSGPAGKGRSKEQRSRQLERLCKEIGNCTRCQLCKGRNHLVFGVGNPDADLMFIGEGPGRDEDRQGIPFVGRAGQLLTRIINAMGYSRDEVYIANIVKCRPPNNRNPLPEEVATCMPFLIRQVEIIGPRAIVCLGTVAAQNLLGTDEKITRLRGHFTEWEGTPVMPTYHPAFLLRNPDMKKPVWEDMKKVMKVLGKKAKNR